MNGFVAVFGRKVMAFYSAEYERHRKIAMIPLTLAGVGLTVAPLFGYANNGVLTWASWVLTGLAAVLSGKDLLRSFSEAYRDVKAWGAPLVPLLGAVLLAVPASFFPRRTGRKWLGGIVESFAYRRENDISFLDVLGSYIRTWPADLLDAWFTYYRGPDPALDLGGGLADGEVTKRESSQHLSYWQRHSTEIIWAAVFGLVFAVIAAVGYEAFAEYLHQRGRVYPWESAE
ncbi:hypothetical protein ACWGLF_16445 [Streptomyces puniciscabiei]